MSGISPRRGWAISIAAALGISIAFFDRQTMSVLAPVISVDLGLTEVQYGLLASGFALALLLGSVFAGWWTMRIGARRAFLIAVLVWSVVAMLHSLAVGFLSLLLLRAALGFTESPSIPAGLESVERVLPVASRPRATGLLFVGSSVGVLVAAPIAVALQQRFGWRTAFFTGAAFAALVWAPTWWWLTSARTTRAAMDDQVERRERRRLGRSFGALVDPATVRAVVVVAGIMPLIAFTTAWEGKWLVASYHLHQSQLGHYLIVGPLLFDVGAFLFGDLASRRIVRRGDGTPPRLLFAIAALLVVSGDLAAAFAPSALAAIGLNAIGAVGRGAILPLVVSDMARRLPPRLVAGGSSAVNGIQALSLVIASIVIGYVVTYYGYRTIIVGLSLWVVLPCLFWLVWVPPVRTEATVGSV